MRLVPESVASFAATAASAEFPQRRSSRTGRSRLRRANASDRPRARCAATVETELLTVVNLPKCLRHVRPLSCLLESLYAGGMTD
jgi:hypothetical protein